MYFFSNKLKQETLLAELLKFNECKYLHQGLNYNACDCTGLPQLIYKKCGIIKKVLKSRYCKDWYKHSKESKIEQNIKLLDLEQNITIIPLKKNESLFFGDLLLLSYNSKIINHCGIYVGNNKFAHIAEHVNYEERKINPKLHKRIKKVMRAYYGL